MTMRAVIHLIAAARPNFMKVAPLYHVLRRAEWCHPVLVHTGQHYDADMSNDILRDLGLPEPDIHLSVGGGTHAVQTAGVMVAYEKECAAERPDWVIVVGDVNSTLACAITAAKLCIPVAHLEAGLRSGDRTMPEEINRVVTDAICDLLWTPSPDADENLRREGVAAARIVRVGNIMIDSYEMLRERIARGSAAAALGLTLKGYAVVTLHRPSNVDDRDRLAVLMGRLAEISRMLPVAFPVHPRTRQRLAAFGLEPAPAKTPDLRLLSPVSYLRFMSLVRDARFVITDSGGIQEETTYLDIPCLTLRENTERPITVTSGTNRLVRAENLVTAAAEVLEGRWQHARGIEFWDGHTADRVAASLERVVQAGGKR